MEVISPWKRFGCLLTIVALLTGCHVDEAKIRVDSPTAPDKLKAEFNVTLPKSAKNMYLAQLAAGLQTFEEYVRFEVDPEEREQAIQAIMAWDAKGQTGMSMYERKPIDPTHFPTPSASIGRIVWWNPGDIKKGYSYVKKNHTRTFWIDEDTHIVYLYWTD